MFTVIFCCWICLPIFASWYTISFSRIPTWEKTHWKQIYCYFLHIIHIFTKFFFRGCNFDFCFYMYHKGNLVCCIVGLYRICCLLPPRSNLRKKTNTFQSLPLFYCSWVIHIFFSFLLTHSWCLYVLIADLINIFTNHWTKVCLNNRLDINKTALNLFLLICAFLVNLESYNA